MERLRNGPRVGGLARCRARHPVVIHWRVSLKGTLRPRVLVLDPPMSQEDSLSFMATADNSYLTHWMDPARKLIARTSLVWKLTA